MHTGVPALSGGEGGVKRSLERTLFQLMIERPEPTHETPQQLSLDKGHD